MSKTQNHLSLTQDHGQAQSKPQGRGTKTVAPTSHGSDFVRKAKVRVSAVIKTQPEIPSQTDFERSHPLLPLSQPQDEKASTSANSTLVGLPGAAVGGSGSFERRAEATGKREMPVGWSAHVPQLVEASQALEGSSSGMVSSGDVVAGASGTGSLLIVEGTEKSKEEEHNYSLFLTRSRQAGRAQSQLEEDEEEEDEEEAEEEEGDGLELDDEDHDEGFGSEHELSENEEEEEEEEDEDYEADKDDDMSDAFSEPGSDPLIFMLLG